MEHLPDHIKKLVEHFDRLPGIGPKTASKLVFFLLQDLEEVKRFGNDLDEAVEKTLFCGSFPSSFTFKETTFVNE